MYLADYHTHSDCSPDGRETIARMAEAAVARGLDEICITDHVDTICWGSLQPRWDFDWDKAQAELAEARRLYGDRLTIRLGAELGEANLAFDRAEHLLDHAPKLDFVIGSVHMAGKNLEILTCTTLKKFGNVLSCTYRQLSGGCAGVGKVGAVQRAGPPDAAAAVHKRESG